MLSSRKSPGVNRIKFSADDIQRKFGPFGEPVTVGFVMGLIIGILAGYDVKRCIAAGGKNGGSDAANATGDQTHHGWFNAHR